MLKRLRLPDNLLKYLVAAILIVIPLFPKFPLISIPGSPVSLRSEDILLAAAFAVYLIEVGRDRIKIWEYTFTKRVGIFLLVGFVSLFSAILVTKTVVPAVGFLHWLRRIEYLVPLFVGYHVLRKHPKALSYFLRLLVIVVFVAFVYGIGQRYLSWPIVTTQNLEYSKGIALRWTPGSHINSTFGGHYDLATFIVLFAPFLVTAFFLIKGNRFRVLLTLAFFASLWLLTSSISRLSVVSFLLSVSLALVFIKRVKLIPVVVGLSILFFASSPTLMGRYLQVFDVFVEKVTMSLSVVADSFVASANTGQVLAAQEDRSSSIRFNVEWPRALRAFSKNPLLGTGYSSITLATDNDYLRLLGEVGLLGLLSFGALILHVINAFLRRFPLSKNFEAVELAFLAGLGGSIPGLLLSATFIDIFEASKFAILFWLLIGFALALLTPQKAHE